MTHYDVLGVAPSADGVALRRAYVELARRHHPDVAGGDAARMQALNEAWETLGDPGRRAAYDRTLAASDHHRGIPPAEGAADEVFEEADDDLDDRPVRLTVVLPRWVSLIPVALFAAAIGSFSFGVILVSTPLLGLAMVSLVLSCVFFLAAPFIALFAARTGGRDGSSQQ
ncbi:MAG: J domain-containing protein [Microthrixaceae bacterium]